MLALLQAIQPAQLARTSWSAFGSGIVDRVLVATPAVVRPAVQVKAYSSAKSAQAVQAHQDLFDLSDHVALVTGAGRGIGRAISLGLARAGAKVVATDHEGGRAHINTLVDEIKDAGGDAMAFVCDVIEHDAINQAVKAAEKHFGYVDVLVANAGRLGDQCSPQNLTDELWHKVFEVNAFGPFNAARAVYPAMKRKGRGKIVLMSSIAAISGYGPQAPYCASKGSLPSLARSLATAWGEDNIQVNCVLPGPVDTDFVNPVLSNPEKRKHLISRIPLGRMGKPEDIVGAIVFFSSAASDFVTGTQLVIDGGGTSRSMADW